MSPDSFTYSLWADKLIAHRFNYRAYLVGTESNFPPLLYLGFVTIVALVKVLAGSAWAVAIIALNLVAESLVGALLVKTVLDVTHSRLAAWGALGLYLICFEIFNWTHFVLSDSTFLLISFALFALMAKVLLTHRPRWVFLTWPTVLALVFLALFYRPTGIVLLPVIMVAFWLWPHRQRANAAFEPLHFHPGVIGAGVFLATALVLAHGYFVQDPARWPFQALSHTIRYTAGNYAAGMVVSGRPVTFHAPPVSLPDYAAITTARFLYFFSFLSSDFSLPHNLIAALFFAPTYLLAGVGLYGLFRRGTGLNGREERVVVLSILLVLAFSFFHALIHLDFDWRYRVPVMPHLIFLAALGIRTVQHRFTGTRASYRITSVPFNRRPAEKSENSFAAGGAQPAYRRAAYSCAPALRTLSAPEPRRHMLP